MNNNELGQSREDYLEAILIIQKRKGDCYSIDVANELQFSKPSVSIAVKKLEAEGYITRNGSGVLQLTESGLDVATTTFEKHTLLTKMFVTLGVNEEIASKDACAIEHHLSPETFEAIKKHYKETN